MKLELSGSESPVIDGHTKKEKEYLDLDHDGCVAADDFGPVDMSRWRSSCMKVGITVTAIFG